MKRCVFTLVCILLASTVLAGYKVVTFIPDAVTSNATYTTVTKTGITGLAKTYSFTASNTNLMWKLETGSGYGLSLSAAKTVVALQTNAAAAGSCSAVYCGQDRLVASFRHTTSGVTATAELRVLIEE
jgi:hypothetical protein